MGELVRARIRRLYMPNAIYFIVGVTRDRKPIFADALNLRVLRTTLHKVKEIYPFEMRAYAFLPDHIHLLIFVPEKTDISKLMHSLKRNFTLNYKKAHAIEKSISLWQRGFWDHVIRDDQDFVRHFDYIHYNPVKHGYVERAGDYAHTSFHEYVKRGWYDPGWGEAEPEDIAKFDFE